MVLTEFTWVHLPVANVNVISLQQSRAKTHAEEDRCTTSEEGL
jgi:hypothetical protein